MPGFLRHDGLRGDGPQAPTQCNLSGYNGARGWVLLWFIAHLLRRLGVRQPDTVRPARWKYIQREP